MYTGRVKLAAMVEALDFADFQGVQNRNSYILWRRL